MRVVALLLAWPLVALAFYRGNIESAPKPSSLRLSSRPDPQLGVRTLPLRNAVEHVPTDYER